MESYNFGLFCRYAVIFFSFLILLLSIMFRNQLDFFIDSMLTTKNVHQNINKKIFTGEELSDFNGISHQNIYLSFMGSVFDVTKGIKHYGKGAPYNYFVGKDGSRAFVTGNFQDESVNKDHVLDLSCNDLFTLLNWRNTLKEKYKLVGFLIGRYYNENGLETEYTKQFFERITQCELEREMSKKELQKFPPCNMEWNADSGTRVWCTKTSGGVKRTWEGVPRQLYRPGESHPQCVCINMNQHFKEGLLKQFDGCSPVATACVINND